MKLELKFNLLNGKTLQVCCNYSKRKPYKHRKFRIKVEAERSPNIWRYRQLLQPTILTLSCSDVKQ